MATILCARKYLRGSHRWPEFFFRVVTDRFQVDARTVDRPSRIIGR